MRQNYKSVDCQISPGILFVTQYPKRYREIPRCRPFEAQNTLRYTKTAFLTPKRYEEHSRPFYIGVSLGSKNCQETLGVDLLTVAAN